ncbi:Carbohydrate sulfotransferase 6 [Holothuria leucospilota]|uniref:Carbohydrate sulfotransferase 6 n=1 Tax=Holothuria leucospilota TaxID=206669 RepID=A0A9Q1BBG1_HOLLE|nr:Carbohydrate sulfotransferase 6 [Holothuria leucospilota]
MSSLGGQSKWRKFAFLLVLMATLCSYYLSVQNGGLEEKFKEALTSLSTTSVNPLLTTNLTRSLLVQDQRQSAISHNMSFSNSTSHIRPTESTNILWQNTLTEEAANVFIKSPTSLRNNVTKTGIKTGVATVSMETEVAPNAIKPGVANIADRPHITSVATERKMITTPGEANMATATETKAANVVPPRGKKPEAVIIVTAKRSGSSFVGEFFNYHPDVFYSFEPLYAVAKMAMKIRGKKINFIDTSLKVLKDSLHCDFNSNYPYQYANAKFCSANEKLARKHLCERSTSWITQRTKISAWERTCKEHKTIVTKLIRIHDIGNLKPFLASTDLEWRIIHLVRDPRPTERSRQKTRPNMDLIRRKGTDKNDEVDLCQTLQRNLKYWMDTPTWLKGRYKMVRYEDIAASPLEKAKELLEFAGLDLADEVVKWIKENTIGRKKDETRGAQFSTSRNAAWVLEAWRHDMDWPFVQKIQKVCSDPMKSLGYALMPDIHSLRDQHIPSTLPLTKPPK